MNAEQLLLGIVAGVAAVPISYLLQAFIRMLWYRFGKRHDYLYGRWFVYHFTTRASGEVILRSETWTIKPGVRHKYAIETSDSQLNDLRYQGHLRRTASDDHLIAQMRGVDQPEEFSVRLPNPIPGDGSDQFYGIKVGVDFQHSLFATVYMFTRQKLENPTATECLRAKLRQAQQLEFLNLG